MNYPLIAIFAFKFSYKTVYNNIYIPIRSADRFLEGWTTRGADRAIRNRLIGPDRPISRSDRLIADLATRIDQPT